MRKNKIFVVGLGLIGGSLAKAFHEHSNTTITGFDPDQATCKKALELGVVDTIERSVGEGAAEADLILLAAPVSGIIKLLDELAAITLKPDVIVTDTGSTKKGIRDQARHVLGPEVCYIGGHPMAGSHKSGVMAAKADLFENAFYFITPEKNTPSEQVERLKGWLVPTRAKVMAIDPESHDEVVGVISHFPHIVAAGLVHQLHLNPMNQALDLPRLAAGGFRDITRIASSDPTLWQDIIMNNKAVLIKLFEDWDKVMTHVKDSLLAQDVEAIFQFFQKAKMARDQFPIKKRGVLPPSYDLYLDITDRPNEISRVTGIIGQAGITIININVIELRENVSGVLRIFFQSDKSRDEAMALLKAHHYNTYVDE
ncbi:prephenate dehydrogenase [Pullulanibacillus camelliae]|uniref:Prephenate dehydrogenase n=1 Tax=Pullulanibacillus camelliae TaxID=1707096 RepID=A0A8J2YEU2_9BACL|nr:prephenate dehydrogenase [Pullulanibacillus camelliae]GGE38837.1 prephenate dehydrogenase [Pullulanibacillus camelliae]